MDHRIHFNEDGSGIWQDARVLLVCPIPALTHHNAFTDRIVSIQELLEKLWSSKSSLAQSQKVAPKLIIKRGPKPPPAAEAASSSQRTGTPVDAGRKGKGKSKSSSVTPAPRFVDVEMGDPDNGDEDDASEGDISEDGEDDNEEEEEDEGDEVDITVDPAPLPKSSIQSEKEEEIFLVKEEVDALTVEQLVQYTEERIPRWEGPGAEGWMNVPKVCLFAPICLTHLRSQPGYPSLISRSRLGSPRTIS